MGRQKTSNNTVISIALIIVLVVLIFFAPSYGWRVRQFLSPSISVSSGDNSIATQADADNLRAQNDALKAQLAQLQVIAAQLPNPPSKAIRAMVYSRYPMNFKNELLVNAGTREGVLAGAAVTFQGILIGQVKAVFPDSAVVQTIFDTSVKIPVRVGNKGYDGLLQGGSFPTLGSVIKTAAIGDGDIIYSAQPGLPYGLPIAEVAETSTSPDSLFQQSSLSFLYDINTIQTVFITQ